MKKINILLSVLLIVALAFAPTASFGLGGEGIERSNSIATITGGSFDDSVIGGTTPAAGSFTTLDTTGNVGIGTASPNAPLEVKGSLPGVVGGFASGTFHITSSETSQFSGSVITGHSSYGTNTQLWYLGSSSSGDDNVAFINRQSGSLSLSTNNTSRLIITSGGYIKLGSAAPAIMMKKLTGTTGGTEGANSFIAHGLTQSKIIGFQVLITATDSIPPSFTAIAEYQYDAYIESTNVVIMLHATNSGNLLNKAITVLITYEE